MKSEVLKLDGAVFDLNKPSATQVGIKMSLDSFPQDEVFTFEKACKLLDVGRNSLRDFSRDERNSGYASSQGPGKMRYFGHPKAIALLKRKLSERAK